MKRIKNFNSHQIYLEGFGFVEFKENTSGNAWIVDFKPQGSENNFENMLIITEFKDTDNNSGRYIRPILPLLTSKNPYDA